MLVEGVRRIERAFGSPIKERQVSEEPCHQKLGKSVVAERSLISGTQLTRSHLAVKVSQPLGWSPQHLEQLYGRILSKSLNEDESVTVDCLENDE